MDIILNGHKLFKSVLENNANIVTLANGKEYYFLPSWFEKTRAYNFKEHSLGNLPKELTDELNNQRTGFKDTTMKRFKTKQEYQKDHPVRSLPHYGEPDIGNRWPYSDDWFTDAPHPYEGKNFKIRVTPEESEKVQKKAFALGYGWKEIKEGEVVHSDKAYLYLDNKRLTWGNLDSTYDDDKNIPLTPQQFLDGDLPLEDWKKLMNECGDDDPGGYKAYAAKLDGLNKFIGRQKKPDAYYNEHNGFIHFWDSGQECQEIIKLAYRYNLMSEEDFKAKHPYKPKLRFMNWNVTVEGDEIRVACKTFTKEGIKAFYEFAKHTRGGTCPAPSLDEVYDFIHKNKKELDL